MDTMSGVDDALDRLQASDRLHRMVGEHGVRNLVQLLARLAQMESDACLVRREQITAAKWAHRYNVLKRAVQQMRG